MGSVPPPTTTKPSSNIAGVFLRFSKLCTLRSVSVNSPKENPQPANDRCFKSEKANCCEDNCNYKVHSQPLEDSLITRSVDALEEAVISRLSVAISALKSAYVQLQQAHIPYEPKKIQSADEVLVSQLESLSELEHLYIKNLRSKPKSKSSLLLEIQEQQGLLEELHSNILAKDAEILRLRWEMEELDLKNVELEEEIKRKASSPMEEVLPFSRELTPSVFAEVFKSTYRSIHDFAKPLINLLKASGWDLNQAASSIAGSIPFAEKSHKKYAFEAYLSRAMLSTDRDDYFDLDHFDRVMSYADPFDALMDDPDSNFGRFCRSKYLVVVHSKMEYSFFGNLDQRAFVLSNGHPRTPLYRAFVRMARWVWALQMMTCSFVPKADIFHARRGDEYSGECMESVVNPVNGGGEDRLEVGLMVMPGFRSQGNVIRCRVYLCSVKPLDG